MSRDDTDYEALMMKAVDGLLSPDEAVELEAWIRADPSRGEELEAFRQIKNTTDQMTERMMLDVQLEPFREPPSTRSVSWMAFAWIFGGLAIALGWAGIEFFSDPNVPAPIRFGFFAAAAGALVLFVRVLWTRMRAAGRDPYEEIDR